MARTKRGAASPAGGRTAFVPGIVFRTVFKAVVPVVTAAALPACLAVDAFKYDAGVGDADGSRDAIPDVGEAGEVAERDGRDSDGDGNDAANAADGHLGASDASGDVD